MILTISTNHQPATELGYLLAKNPSRVQTFKLPFGQAHVFYTEASEDKCTAALLLDIDPISLVRGAKDSRADGLFDQYVNDRPYVASSFLSVAINNVFGSALSGKCRDKPELVNQEMNFTATISAVESPGGEPLLRRLFEPLGYDIEVVRHKLDPAIVEFGDSKYFSLTLSKKCLLRDLLSHIYVLIPVLDDEKHYFVGEEEVHKLLRHGTGWLAKHPENAYITKRYLQHKSRLTKIAMERLNEGMPDQEVVEERNASEEANLEKPLSLNQARMQSVVSVLQAENVQRVVDVGCGEGKLLSMLMQEHQFTEIVGMDVSNRSLEIASHRLKLAMMSERQRQRIKLIQGSLTYTDKRLAGFDAATCVEVIEHIDEDRLPAFERVLFEFAAPRTIVLTTPNSEYNAKFENLPAHRFRHKDHRFEWTRGEFKQWSDLMCKKFGYAVTFLPVGPEDAELGAPTQMAVFKK